MRLSAFARNLVFLFRIIALKVRTGFVIEGFYFVGFIIGVVTYKKIQVNNAAQPHHPGLQKNKQENICAHPPKEPVIIGAHAN